MRSRWGAGGGGWDGVDVAHLLRNQGERAVALWLDEPIRNLWQAHLVLRRALLPQQLGAKQPAAEADIARVGGGRAPGPAISSDLPATAISSDLASAEAKKDRAHTDQGSRWAPAGALGRRHRKPKGVSLAGPRGPRGGQRQRKARGRGGIAGSSEIFIRLRGGKKPRNIASGRDALDHTEHTNLSLDLRHRNSTFLCSLAFFSSFFFLNKRTAGWREAEQPNAQQTLLQIYGNLHPQTQYKTY